jgi:quercetin dioxygenase-like cupin family protein
MLPRGGVHGPLANRVSGETITGRERREVVLLADRQELSISWSRYAPGERGPEPHVHREHVDSFYVLDGELAFALGPEAERTRLSAGGFLAVPVNLIHSFVNEGPTEAQFLNFHTPDGGFAGFLRAGRDGGVAAFDSCDPPEKGGLPASEAIVCGPGEGERVQSGSGVVVHKAALPELRMTEWELLGPFESDLHLVEARVDSLYVLAGVLEVTIDGTSHRAGPGTLATVAPGSRYGLVHRGTGRARVLRIQAPGGE